MVVVVVVQSWPAALLLLLAAVRAGAPALALETAAIMNLYVAPGGSDTAAGTAAAPLASCAGAVAIIKRQSTPLPSITVHFAPGDYPLTNDTTCGTITFTGSKAAPIVFSELCTVHVAIVQSDGEREGQCALRPHSLRCCPAFLPLRGCAERYHAV
jgi:hypothetical protein